MHLNISWVAEVAVESLKKATDLFKITYNDNNN